MTFAMILAGLILKGSLGQILLGYGIMIGMPLAGWLIWEILEKQSKKKK